MEKQLNRSRRKHSVKVSFTGQMVGDVKVIAEIEGIRANVDKSVSSVQVRRHSGSTRYLLMCTLM